ncbi:flagellar export protein FliJ [Pontibacillus salicampi]|uniref:Flagellar FliJ protein n=1 Tax=Pontibacillus salicampi TaxID=1449801 RepID=A0ABV6LP07_9BACI
MAELSTYHKLLQMKETDKNLAHKDYQDSVEVFEEVATKMYELLKKKEQAEAHYQKQIQHSMQITDLHTSFQYIDRLEKQIANLQQAIHTARSDMQQKQESLTSAHVEMKKYEKIIDRKEYHIHTVRTYEEKKQMDDMSMQQFLSQGIR